MKATGHVSAKFPDDGAQCSYLSFHSVTVIGDALRPRSVGGPDLDERFLRPYL